MKFSRFPCKTALMISLAFAGAPIFAANSQPVNPPGSSPASESARPAVTSADYANQQQTGSASSGASGADASADSSMPVTFVLVPIEVATTTTLIKTGCWARIYSEPSYKGDSLTLSGPLSMPSMVGPFGINWKNKVRSIETGVKATATIYDNRNFKDKVTQFQPGKKVPDVSKKMGFFDDFGSMQITCGK